MDCPKPIVIARALAFYLGNEVKRSQVRDYLYVIRSGYPNCDMELMTKLVVEELEAIGTKVLNDFRNEIAKYDDGYVVTFDGEKVVIEKDGRPVRVSEDWRVRERIYELVRLAKSGKEFVDLVDALENYEKEIEYLKEKLRSRVY